jgi:hypothetical protein
MVTADYALAIELLATSSYAEIANMISFRTSYTPQKFICRQRTNSMRNQFIDVTLTLLGLWLSSILNTTCGTHMQGTGDVSILDFCRFHIFQTFEMIKLATAMR